MNLHASTNADDFDDFDLDNIDDGMLEDLLKEELEMLDSAPTNQPHHHTAPISSGWTHAQPYAQPHVQQYQPQHQHTSKQQQHASKQQKPSGKTGQLTLDALFGNKRDPQTFSSAKRPGTPDSSGYFRQQRPAKAPRVDKVDNELELIEIDSDCEELISECVNANTKPPLPLPLPPPARSHFPQQQQQQQFQARELVIKICGDNQLVEQLHAMNKGAMSTYVYPLLGNQPARAYQQGAVQRCLFQNTLVALPTGMGKTLIAVVVMANYTRWFPNSLAIFLAPTKPLVAQQMQACRGMIHAILSHSPDNAPLGSDWVVEMNGTTPPKSREKLWTNARCVFSTPQILQNDLKSGTLSVENAQRIVLLVIDEAHRATGKYAYGASIGHLYRIHHGVDVPTRNSFEPARPAPFRTMCLTATPGSNMDAVNEIMRQLHVAHVFIRTEESIDVVPYIHGRCIEEEVIEMPPWLVAAREVLVSVMRRSTNILCNICKVMSNPADLTRVSGYSVRMECDRFQRAPFRGGAAGMDMVRIVGEFNVVVSLAHIIQLLSEHGLRPAWGAIRAWDQEVKRAKAKQGTSSRARVDCVESREWENMMRDIVPLVDALDGKTADHPASASRLALGAPGASGVRLGHVRTDVASSFFNVSSKYPPKSSAGQQAQAQAQSPLSLAPAGFLGHPKLNRLVEIVRDHFEHIHGENGATAAAEVASTRIIVFSQYRGSVSEIVSVLGRSLPLVKCEPFIGQSKAGGGPPNKKNAPTSSTSSGRGGGFRGGFRGGGFRGGFHGSRGGFGGGFSRGGNDDDSDGCDAEPGLDDELPVNDSDIAARGQTQKEQLAVLTRFRQGQTNVIVATCVGEEGLDIGEVDLIINYDAPGSPIRLLQRIGRTGRARRGKVFVFLAKGTREENSYKKAQKEYKSVQAKIASGKGLALRTDLSPPMLPPSLPPGQPARVEVHLSKQDIKADGVGLGVVAGRGGAGAARGKRLLGGTGVGVDAHDLGEFRRLSLKYTMADDRTAGSGSHGASPILRLLGRGMAWQSVESPHCSVEHNHRSTTYHRIMYGLEQARFSLDLASGGQVDPGKSLFQMQGMPRPDIAALNVSMPTFTKPPLNRRINTAATTASTTTATTGVVRAARSILREISNGSNKLEDIDVVLDRQCKRRAISVESSSPLDDSFLFAPRTPPPLNNSGAKERGASAYVHVRKPSSQSNIFEAIENLVRSGKAKRVFDWSVDVLDSDMLKEAEDRGIDLELQSVFGEPIESAATTAGMTVPVPEFGDIGRPGTFDKLYDDKIPNSVPRQLCIETDSEDELPDDLLAEADNWVFSGLDDLQSSLPPPSLLLSPPSQLTQPIPESSPPLPLQLTLAIPESSPPVHEMLLAPDELMSKQQSAHVIEEDSADEALLNFDMNSDIFILSDDDDKEPPVIGAASTPAILPRDSTPFRSVSHVAEESGTRPSLPDYLMSSSPLKPRFKFVPKPTPTGVSPLDKTAGDTSSPVRKPNGRLKRGRQGPSSATVVPPLPVVDTPDSPLEPARMAKNKLEKRKKNSRKFLAPSPCLPKKRAFNPFIDAEAEIGDSDSDNDGSRVKKRGNPGISDDESDGDHLDRNLSSFIVDDEEIEYDTPGGSNTVYVDGQLQDTEDTAVTPRRIGDIYRQSLALAPETPVSVIMQRLAEREKQRRWVNDTPSQPRSSPLVGNRMRGGDALSSGFLDDSSSTQNYGAVFDDVESSDFENLE
ncbi:3'-5' DNA helicase [Kickxella alabastrina]|nr:3'-5' DNA helicase [Kickxella alabastrina]